jgi:hypothetical protein
MRITPKYQVLSGYFLSLDKDCHDSQLILPLRLRFGASIVSAGGDSYGTMKIKYILLAAGPVFFGFGHCHLHAGDMDNGILLAQSGTAGGGASGGSPSGGAGGSAGGPASNGTSINNGAGGFVSGTTTGNGGAGGFVSGTTTGNGGAGSSGTMTGTNGTGSGASSGPSPAPAPSPSPSPMR